MVWRQGDSSHQNSCLSFVKLDTINFFSRQVVSRLPTKRFNGDVLLVKASSQSRPCLKQC